MIEKHELGDNKEVWLPGIVPKLSATPGGTKWIGPMLGEHTADVLRSIGYDDAAQVDLKKRRII
jgi:formyl-CoA transferase